MKTLALTLLFLSSAGSPAQYPVQPSAPPAASAPARTPYYIDPTIFALLHGIPPSPPQDGPVTRAELAEMHRIERDRTPAEVAAAQFDDSHEDIFLYANVLGPAFTAENLPLTAALSKHLRNDVGIVNKPLKDHFARPRPYNADTTLHPVCPTNKDFSYPSGHSFNGYLFALVLTQLFPARSAEILARADVYAHNRVICEAHYPSDLEASRRAAYALFGALLETPRFQSELNAARTEVGSKFQPQSAH